jgi:hypothetical protein
MASRNSGSCLLRVWDVVVRAGEPQLNEMLDPPHRSTGRAFQRKYEGSMQTVRLNKARCAIKTQDVAPWLPTDHEEACAIQVGSPRGSYSLVQNERDDGHSFEAPTNGEELTEEGDFEPQMLGGDSVEIWQPGASQQPESFFVRRTRDTAGIPKCLTGTQPTSNAASWTVSAPKIDRAVMKLCELLKRPPTDSEIANELNLSMIHYQEGLMLLSDIETEIRAPGITHGGAQLVPNSRDFEQAVFCCLRSEMLTLFRSAVEDLPRSERLHIAFEYFEGILDMELSLTLNVAESKINDAGAYSGLHLRARLFGTHELDHCGGGEDVTPAFGRRRSVKKPTGPEAHVYMTAGQHGWLRKGHAWENLGANVRYNHLLFKWFSACDDGELKLVKKHEKKDIKYEEEQMMPC